MKEVEVMTQTDVRDLAPKIYRVDMSEALRVGELILRRLPMLT